LDRTESPARQAAEMADAPQLAADPEVARLWAEVPDVAAERLRLAAARVVPLAAQRPLAAVRRLRVAEAGRDVPAGAAAWRPAAWAARSDLRQAAGLAAAPVRVAALHPAHRNVLMHQSAVTAR